MTTFSRSYTNALELLFYSRYTNTIVVSDTMPEQIAHLQFSAQDSEIPCLYTGILKLDEEIIHVAPLYLHSREYNCRTSEALIKKFFTSGNQCGYLFKGILGSRVYYGNKGILLDKDYNVLFLATSEPRTYTIAHFKNIYISPRVFTNLSDPINKHIVQKIIPFFCLNDSDVNIHIKDMNHLLKKPVFPKSVEEIQEEIINYTQEFMENIDFKDFYENPKPYLEHIVKLVSENNELYRLLMTSAMAAKPPKPL